jgi:hypothetical protein
MRVPWPAFGDAREGRAPGAAANPGRTPARRMMRSAARVLGQRPPGRLLRCSDDQVKSSPSWAGVTPFARYVPRPARTVTLSSGTPTFVATSHAAWSSFSVRRRARQRARHRAPSCNPPAWLPPRAPIGAPQFEPLGQRHVERLRPPADGRPSPRVKPPPSAAIAERRPGRASSHWWLQRSGRRSGRARRSPPGRRSGRRRRRARVGGGRRARGAA